MIFRDIIKALAVVTGEDRFPAIIFIMTRELAAIAISRFVEIGMREVQLFAFFSCIVVLDEWLAGNDRSVPSNK